VAFCLIICLRKHLRDRGHWRTRPEPNLRQACDLVALGTVADMVPLVGENRILARTGLAVINERARPGIRALADVSRIGGRPVDGEDIAFRLAPRINAAGRMEAAGPAVALLTTGSSMEAEKIAAGLERLNTERQQLERQILEEILTSLKDTPELAGAYSLVLAAPHWHEGVLGIVASRLVAIYHRPVVLAAIRDGVARGSARGIPGIDLFGLVRGCADLLDAFGGHAMAAGLKLKMHNIARLKKRFESLAAAAIAPEQLRPTLVIDSEIRLDDITDTFIDELESMQPFGEANPEPLFMARDVKVHTSALVGRTHRSMQLSQSTPNGSRRIRTIQFNIDPLEPQADHLERIAFRIRWNRWNGRKTAQLIIEET
jgi:single-stranded-DNA-specific exonuclease